MVHDADKDRFWAGNLLPFVVPLVRSREHVLANAFAHCRILQALDELGVATVVGPRRYESGEVVEPCRIGVSIRGDVEARSARGIDLGDGFRHASPAGFAANFEMPDFYWDVSFATDAQRFVNGGQDASAFVAHVRGVDAAELGGFRGEGDQLFGLGVGSGSVFESSGDPDGAVAHGLADQVFHLLKLSGRRLHVIIAEHDAADARCADVAGNIDADALLFEARKVFAKRTPVDLNVIVIVLLLVGAENGVVQRGNRFALAGDFRGDALIDFRGQARIDEDGVLRLSEHVDETGSNDFAAGVDGTSARRGAEIADGRDLAGANSDVTGIPGRARAVDDVAVGDDNIERLCGHASLDGCEAEEQNQGQKHRLPLLKLTVGHSLILASSTTQFISRPGLAGHFTLELLARLSLLSLSRRAFQLGGVRPTPRQLSRGGRLH